MSEETIHHAEFVVTRSPAGTFLDGINSVMELLIDRLTAREMKILLKAFAETIPEDDQ